jgi:hypothetical protein
VNLTHTLDGQGSHPMATSQLGKYLDHTKGARKALGYSPENKWRRDPVLGNGKRPDHQEMSGAGG